MSRNVVPYSEVLKQLTEGKTHHLLIGNGFSIGCDPCFSYPSLYAMAKNIGLSNRAQKIFERFGTNNFEAVMRLLDDGNWLADTYGLINGESEIAKDLDTLKKVLIESIAKSHPEHTGRVPEEKKQKAANFFSLYHNIFSLNYDLLPYWINMVGQPPVYEDGFREDSDDADAFSLVFSERIGENQGLYFIHGALHLFMGDGGLRKHCWSRTLKPITALIGAGLELGLYPLFVAEGDAEKKMQQIQASGYLSYCYGKLGRIKQRIVTYGFSFGQSDRHITDVIIENTDLTQLFVGVYPSNGRYSDDVFHAVERMVERRKQITAKDRSAMQLKRQLSVVFFDSSTSGVWG